MVTTLITHHIPLVHLGACQLCDCKIIQSGLSLQAIFRLAESKTSFIPSHFTLDILQYCTNGSRICNIPEARNGGSMVIATPNHSHGYESRSMLVGIHL